MKSEVLVTGAGPVGLAMAAELACYGVSVRIVEKAARRTDKSKALVIWSRTLELMDRLGCGTALLDAGLKVSRMSIIAGHEEIAHMTLSDVETPHPYALVLPQSETERILEEHLNSLGVEIERSVELTRFKDDGGQVSCVLRHSDGREEAVATSWLIGCDGAHSTVRHQLGMKFAGDTLTTDWILGDVHLSGVPNEGEVSVAWHADGVLAIFPISGDRYRVIADVGEAVSGPLRPDPTLEEVQAYLDKRRPAGIRASAPIWLAAFRINERKVSEYRAGRVFVAGDAAHIHSPAGGQGMNTGIQDACNLAWKLALVCRNICEAEPLLGSYSMERSAVGEQVLKGAGWATTIATLKGGIKQSVRNHVAALVFGLSRVRKSMADAVTEVSIGYPNSPLSVRGGHIPGGPVAGERAPIHAMEPPLRAGEAPRFTLFSEPDASAAPFAARYPNLLDPNVRQPYSAGGLWLVRPDGYTALAARRGEWQQVAGYLDRLGVSQRTRTAGESS